MSDLTHTETLHEVCDSCGHPASVIVAPDGGEPLTFCRRHFYRNAAALDAARWRVEFDTRRRYA